MSRCTSGANRIKGRLPSYAIAPGLVMDKTGTVGRCTNDCGILTLPDGSHVAVSLFVKASTLEVETREAAIADMTRSVYDFFLFTGPPAKL